MLEVLFNTVEEFVEELRRDDGKTDDGIVRATFEFRPTKLYPVKSVAFLASFVRRGQVVTLRQYCGDYAPHFDEANAKTDGRGEAAKRAVEDAAAALGLGVRPGVYRHADAKA